MFPYLIEQLYVIRRLFVLLERLDYGQKACNEMVCQMESPFLIQVDAVWFKKLLFIYESPFIQKDIHDFKKGNVRVVLIFVLHFYFSVQAVANPVKEKACVCPCSRGWQKAADNKTMRGPFVKVHDLLEVIFYPASSNIVIVSDIIIPHQKNVHPSHIERDVIKIMSEIIYKW